MLGEMQAGKPTKVLLFPKSFSSKKSKGIVATPKRNGILRAVVSFIPRK